MVLDREPERSHTWRFKPIAGLAVLPGVMMFTGDQCKFGNTFRKSTTWVTNASWLGFLQGKCPGPPSHPVHPTLMGRSWANGKWVWNTSLAAEYPEGLCEALSETYFKAVKEQPVKTPPEVRVRLDGVITQSNREPGYKASEGGRSQCLHRRFAEPGQGGEEGSWFGGGWQPHSGSFVAASFR